MVARSEKAVTITIINITNSAGAGGWVRTGQGSAVSRHRLWVFSDGQHICSEHILLQRSGMLTGAVYKFRLH